MLFPVDQLPGTLTSGEFGPSLVVALETGFYVLGGADIIGPIFLTLNNVYKVRHGTPEKNKKGLADKLTP